MIRLQRLNSTRNKTKIHAFPAKWPYGTPDPYLKRSLQRGLHCEDSDQGKRSQKDRNAARIAKRARESARSLAPARKDAPCSMRLLSCLTASSQSAPIATGRGDPELRFWRARRGTGGAKRGRFSRRSEGGPQSPEVCLFPRLCAPVGGAFASTALLPFQCAVCVCSVYKGGPGEACVMPPVTRMRFFASANGKKYLFFF
jgi:hypothetical protein